MNMRARAILLLVALAASAQSTKKAAPARPQMSHDFRTAGRRVVTVISDLGRSCITVCSLDADLESEGKVSRAIEEADAQHDNAVDKQALELLNEYNAATFDAVLDREALAIEARAKQAGIASKSTHQARCNAGACEAMYATCKKEAKQAFETRLMPAKVECKSLSPRDSK